VNQIFLSGEYITEHFFECDQATYHHLFSVHRTRVGEILAIVTEKWRFTVKIKKNEKTKIFYELIEKVAVKEKLPVYTLFQSLPKQDKMGTIIDYAVQLGITDIFPIVTNRTVVKWDDKKALKNLERWQTKAESAANQAKQDKIPRINKVLSLKDCLTQLDLSGFDELIVFWEEVATNRHLFDQIKNKNVRKIGFLIGPEGGLDKSEIEMLEKMNFKVLSLGDSVLRVEIAATVALSQLKLLYT
tara:strand:+ start:2830 stop:3561 length:732 start_codon:yes stop_codon:yes gene_type:complete